MSRFKPTPRGQQRLFEAIRFNQCPDYQTLRTVATEISNAEGGTPQESMFAKVLPVAPLAGAQAISSAHAHDGDRLDLAILADRGAELGNVGGVEFLARLVGIRIDQPQRHRSDQRGLSVGYRVAPWKGS